MTDHHAAAAGGQLSPRVPDELRSGRDDAHHVVVRPILPADADGYLAVFATVAAEGRWIGTEAPIAPERQERIRGAATVPTDRLFVNVAVDDDRVVGFAGLELNDGLGHLFMAILDGYRGEGLGRRLLDGAIGWAQDSGAYKVDLEVWPHNTAARRLYERAGFVTEGHRRRQWRRRNGQLWDSVQMGLVLDETSPGSPFHAE